MHTTKVVGTEIACNANIVPSRFGQKCSYLDDIIWLVSFLSDDLNVDLAVDFGAGKSYNPSMKTRNFPAKKKLRQLKALRRLGETVNVVEPVMLARSERSKKDRSARGRISR